MNAIIYYFWVFVITSILGFIIETIWCFIKNKKIESRKGLIYEPMIPIYGVAGLLIVLVIRTFKLSNVFNIFLIGFSISTIIEFISSVLQEKIFATRSWDYKNFPLNLNGRINLPYSILFGLVAILIYKLVLIPTYKLFATISFTWLIITITIVTLVFMLYDFTISFIAVYRMKERKRNILRDQKFWVFIDKKYNDEYLKKIYANMVDV